MLVNLEWRPTRMTMKLSPASLNAFVLACFLACIGQTARGGPAAQVDAAKQHIDQARAAFARQKYGEARKELNRALSSVNGSSEAHLMLAQINRLEDKLDEALADVQKALEYKSGNAEAHMLYARLLFETGNHNEARKQLATALSLTPPDATSFLLKGDMDIGDGKYELAIESYAEASRLLPEGDSARSVIRMRLEAVRNHLALVGQPFGDPANARPRPLNRPRPEYTGKARWEKTQGSVTLALLVSEKGVVTNAFILMGLKDGLSAEAIKAARRIKFKPAQRDGNPVPCLQVIEVEFKLA